MLLRNGFALVHAGRAPELLFRCRWIIYRLYTAQLRAGCRQRGPKVNSGLPFVSPFPPNGAAGRRRAPAAFPGDVARPRPPPGRQSSRPEEGRGGSGQGRLQEQLGQVRAGLAAPGARRPRVRRDARHSAAAAPPLHPHPPPSPPPTHTLTEGEKK